MGSIGCGNSVILRSSIIFAGKTGSCWMIRECACWALPPHIPQTTTIVHQHAKRDCELEKKLRAYTESRHKHLAAENPCVHIYTESRLKTLSADARHLRTVWSLYPAHTAPQRPAGRPACCAVCCLWVGCWCGCLLGCGLCIM